MIINLLAVLVILATGAVAGILLTIQHYEHLAAEMRADEDALAEVQELYAAWAMIRAYSPASHEPGALDPRDRLPS